MMNLLPGFVDQDAASRSRRELCRMCARKLLERAKGIEPSYAAWEIAYPAAWQSHAETVAMAGFGPSRRLQMR
jgi:hypothetical protein